MPAKKGTKLLAGVKGDAIKGSRNYKEPPIPDKDKVKYYKDEFAKKYPVGPQTKKVLDELNKPPKEEYAKGGRVRGVGCAKRGYR